MHFHQTAEAAALLQLLGDVEGDKLGVQIGVLDLLDAHAHLAVDQLLERFTELVDLGTLGANDHARTGRGDDHLDFVEGAFDFHFGAAGVRSRAVELAVDQLTDLEILDEELGVSGLRRVPARAPILGDADAEPGWMRLLSHGRYFLGPSPTVTTMWLVRL